MCLAFDFFTTSNNLAALIIVKCKLLETFGSNGATFISLMFDLICSPLCDTFFIFTCFCLLAHF